VGHAVCIGKTVNSYIQQNSIYSYIPVGKIALRIFRSIKEERIKMDQRKEVCELVS
jgi:hypothetical protein